MDMSRPEKDQQLHEIRFHGRGGQGAVSAAALLSLAAFDDGFEAQAFPKFGSERRGAPVEAYVRISSRPIRSHTQIYQPDAVIVQDRTLLRSEPVTNGLVPRSWVILNAQQCPQEADNDQWRWLCVPADRISEDLLGRPLPNTVLLGALVAATGWISLVALEQAIGSHLQRKGEKVVEANIAALREGHRVAQLQQVEDDIVRPQS